MFSHKEWFRSIPHPLECCLMRIYLKLLQTAVGQPQAEEDAREKNERKSLWGQGEGLQTVPHTTCSIYICAGSSFCSCVKLPGKEGCWSCPWILSFPSHPQAPACAYKRSGNLAGSERGAELLSFCSWESHQKGNRAWGVCWLFLGASSSIPDIFRDGQSAPHFP